MEQYFDREMSLQRGITIMGADLCKKSRSSVSQIFFNLERHSFTVTPSIR